MKRVVRLDKGAARIALAAAVLVLLAFAAKASAQGAAGFYMEDTAFQGVVVLDNTTIAAIAGSPKPLLLVLTYDTPSMLYPRILESIPLPETPTAIAYDGIKYVAVGMRDGTIKIVNWRNPREQYVFGIPATPTKLVFVNGSLVVLATVGRGEQHILYVLSPGRLGWAESRPVVGTLLAERIESVEPVAITPVVYTNASGSTYFGEALVLYQVKPVALYTLEARIYIVKNNETFVPVGAAVYIYDANITRLLGESVVDSNGSIAVPLAALEYPLKLYVAYNGTCYTYTISENSTVLQAENIAVIPQPIRLSSRDEALCPRILHEYQLALLRIGPRGPVLAPINLPVYALTFNVLYARRDHNLYMMLVGGESLAIGGVVYRGRGFAYIYLNMSMTGNTSIVGSRYYASIGLPSTATASADGDLVIVGTNLGVIYFAKRSGNGYLLKWAVKLPRETAYLRIARLSNTTYLIAAADSVSSIAVYRYNVLPGLVEPVLNPATGYVNLNTSSIAGLEFMHSARLLAATDKGLFTITGIEGFAERKASISELLLKSITINLVDEYGDPVYNATVEYRLETQDNETVLAGAETLHGNTSSLRLPCAAGLLLAIKVEPLATIYIPVKHVVECSTVLEQDTATIQVPVKKVTLALRILDGFTGGPPVARLAISAVNTVTGETVNASLNAGVSDVTLQLKAGTYNLTVRDKSGEVYRSWSQQISLETNTSINIVLERIPATVTVIVEASARPDMPDKMTVTLYSANGTLLGRVEGTAPLPGKPVAASFTTLYRGPGRVTILFSSGKNDVGSFFANESIEVNVTRASRYTVRVRPVHYNVTIAILDNVTGRPVKCRVEVRDSRGREIAKIEAANVSLSVVRGYYNITLIPLPDPKFHIPMYEPHRTTIYVAGNGVREIRLKPVRIPVNVTVRDPYTPNGALIDNVKVIVDDKEVTTIKAGKPPAPVQVPVHINGSILVLKPEKKEIYNELKRPIMVKDNNTLIVYQRKMYNVKVSVVDDQGKPVGAVNVNITGLDLRYTTTLITDSQGVASTSLPYGSYEVCCSRAGYKGKCVTVQVASDVDTTIALVPEPLTVVKRYLSVIAAMVFAIVTIVVVRLYFKKILARLAVEEEF